MKNNIKKKAITKEEIARAFILFAKAVGEYLDELEEKISQDEYKESDHPRDKNGQYKKKGSSKETSKDIQAKIDKLNNIDWNNDNTLDGLNKETLEEYDLEDKPISLKANVINRNKERHPDISEEDAVKILGNALYKTEVILKGKEDRPDYFNLITRTDDKHSDLVLLDMVDTKDKYEIVHFFQVRNKNRRALERDDKRQS